MLKRIFLFVTIGMAFSSTALASDMSAAHTGELARNEIDLRGAQCSNTILKALESSDDAQKAKQAGTAGTALSE